MDLEDLSAEDERTLNDSYEKQKFGLGGMRRTVRAMYIDKLSYYFHFGPVTGRGVAMQSVMHSIVDRKCNCCKTIGYPVQDCAILTMNERRNGRTQRGQHAQRK